MAALYEELRELFYNPRHSDLEIVCQNDAKFKVHRIMIYLHSPILDAMVTEQLDDNGKMISRIELPDVEFNTLYMMLQFFYGGNYSDFENLGSNHAPSYVLHMSREEVIANLETLPCLYVDSTTEADVVDDEYVDRQRPDQGRDAEPDESLSDGDTSSEDSQDSNKDDERIRIFQGHNLSESLKVYCLASRFNILPLRLLARDRFYRTAEKVLMYSPDAGNEEEAAWWTQDHQRVYRSKLAKAIFDNFPQAVDELYQTVPESDKMMRAIPPMLIAAGYNNDGFRNHMKPLLEKYPELALAVVECMRIPPSLE